MAKVFVNQTNWKLVITCNLDITDSTSNLIQYRNPNGETGSLTATVTNETTGVLEFLNSDGDINVAGAWWFWPDITLASTLRAIGSVVKVDVYEDGNPVY